MSDSLCPKSLFTPLQFRRTEDTHFQARNDRAGWTRCFLLGWNPVERTVRTMKERRRIHIEVWTEITQRTVPSITQVCCQLARASACCKPAAKGRPGSGTPLFETAERGDGVPRPSTRQECVHHPLAWHRKPSVRMLRDRALERGRRRSGYLQPGIVWKSCTVGVRWEEEKNTLEKTHF